jgi:hypothetical protein
MNDFERRFLDVIQTSEFIQTVARPDAKIVATAFFAYNVTIENVVAAGTGQGVIQIEADSDFVLTYMSAQTVSAGAIVASPLQRVQVTDTGTGKTFSNVATLQNLWFGNTGFPFLLPGPRVIVPNTNLLVSVENFSAVTYSTDFSFLGMRIYYA